MKILFGSLAFLTLAACGSGGGAAVLTHLTDITTSAKCPSGGVSITAGPDTNGNGLLDATEVTQTNEVCNGAIGVSGPTGAIGATGDAGVAGPASLIDTTVLNTGDMACPAGGVKIDFGTDDGAGGGTAGNGVLEAGEVRGSRTVCNGTKGGSYIGSVTPPAGPVGTNRISTNGARGLEGNGGDAGNIDFAFDEFAGSLGGHIKVFKTGGADAGFALPAITFEPGLNPMTISSNYTLKAYATGALGVSSADPYFQLNNDNQVFSHDAGTVTSISVGAGATLSITGSSATDANLFVNGDFTNAGTILVGTNGTTSKNFEFQSNGRILGSAGSVITTAGLPGGNGGDVTLRSYGEMAYQGTITTSGGDSGGNAGSVVFQALQARATVAGTFTMLGGTNSGGIGGRGGSFTMTGYGTFNAASVRGSGGNGTTAGGQGGGVTFFGPVNGVANRGSFVMKGGSCTAVACVAGKGGQASITAQGADLIWSGTLDVSGGGAPGTGNAFGGNGGSITVVHGETPFGGVRLANGATQFSGDLLVEGGEGANGGVGGGIAVKKNCATHPVGQEIEFFGYVSITANGGTGTAGTTPGKAGNGGGVTMQNAASTLSVAYDANTSQATPVLGASGGVINYANISTRGGDGLFAGRPNSVLLSSQTQRSLEGKGQIVINAGTIDVGSGSGANNVLSGGVVLLIGLTGVESRGEVKSNGGSGSGTATGGGGGTVQIVAFEGPAIIAAPVTASGGAVTGANTTGGYGGYVYAYGKSNVISANITVNGGDAVNTGGSGGSIQVRTLGGPLATITGMLSASGGTGVTPGSGGSSIVDGKYTRF